MVDVRDGESRVLVVQGEAGIGKTALLEHVVAGASGCRVARSAGVESEMELTYAGLQQLCSPFLDRLELLPAPQRAALGTAFGLTGGEPPDRFLVGLAVMTLLSDEAREQPVLCVIDDAQWLDRVSAQVVAFVARRLLATRKRIALVLAVREANGDVGLDGLPGLVVRGLGEGDARSLLHAELHGPLDAAVRDRIIAECRGNPLALLELPRAWTMGQLAGGFGLPDAPLLAGRIEQAYVYRLRSLPTDTQLLLLVAAAEPLGDATLLWRAADRLGIDAAAALAAEDSALIEFGPRVTFRHPLVRSATYRSSTPQERRTVHLALAEETDLESDPDRRAWHLAAAARGPDEHVALELERSAGRAQARGGFAAAAAFLQRSVSLTHDPARRADRALAAAQANLQAGALDAALGLLVTARTLELDELQRARADLLEGQIAFASGHGSDAPPLLLNAAQQLEPLDLELARDTYLDAWGAAMFAGSLAGAGGLLESSKAARAALLPTQRSRPVDLLLDGLTMLVTEGRAAAAPLLRGVTSAFADGDATAEDDFRWGWLALVPSNVLWDEKGWQAINVRQLQRARDAGALTRLPIDLTGSAIRLTWYGDFAAAAASIAEADAIAETTQSRIAATGAMLLAAFRGRAAEATELIDATIADATAGGQGIAVQYSQWVAAILFNGLGRYDQALTAAQRASRDTPELFLSPWAMPELIEASVRSGNSSPRSRCTRASGGGHDHSRHRLGAGDRGPVARHAERRCDRGEAVPGGAGPAEPHEAPSGVRPCAPALRRMAAPTGAARQRAHPARHGARDVHHDRHGGVRRARPPRAAGDR